MSNLKVLVRRTGLALAIALSGTAQAQMTYFDGGIDYWLAQHKPQRDTPQMPSIKTSQIKPRFDWQTYLNPKNDEFFREGEYVPPAPFMEVARDPSDENLRLWFTYIAKKNAVATRLEERMAAFGQDQGTRPPAAAVASPRAEEKPATADLDPNRFVVRFYFDSQCPHCRRMAPEVEKLRRLGFLIEARQVDRAGAEARPALSVPVRYATSDELRSLGIQSVPTLLIADRRGSGVFRISGYQSAESVVRTLSSQR